MVEARPILFMKTGVICSEPLGFYDELAKRYAADLHVTDDICLELTGGFSRERSVVLAVREIAETRTRESLAEGNNAVYDGFLNTYARRETVRKEVAGPSGAITVLICMHAPLDVIRARIIDRHKQNQLSIPSMLIPDVEQTLGVAERMISSVEWPRASEPHANLNGKMEDKGLLIRRVAKHMEIEGILSS